MSIDTTRPEKQSTTGVDAAPLERYSAVRTDGAQLIVETPSSFSTAIE